VIGVADNLILMLAALFVVGAATGAGVVIWGTLLQRLVPLDMIGRVASLDFFVSIAFMPVSIAIAGPLSLLVPIPVIFVIAGVLPLALALIAIVAGRMRESEEATSRRLPSSRTPITWWTRCSGSTSACCKIDLKHRTSLRRLMPSQPRFSDLVRIGRGC
jgi:hypothetical protein